MGAVDYQEAKAHRKAEERKHHQHHEPTVQHHKPAVQHQKPAVQHQKPAVQHQKPAVQHQKPAVQHQKPAVQPAKPKPQKHVDKEDCSVEAQSKHMIDRGMQLGTLLAIPGTLFGPEGTLLALEVGVEAGIELGEREIAAKCYPQPSFSKPTR